MKKILTFLLVLICLQSIGQKPIIVKPTQKPPVTQIPPGQVINQQERMKEVMKSREEKEKKQAAIDKVLNATIKQADFIWKFIYQHGGK